MDLARAIRDFFDGAMDRDSVCDHTILVMGVPAKSFIVDNDDNTENDEEPLIPQKCKLLYLQLVQALFATMAAPPTERPAGCLSG